MFISPTVFFLIYVLCFNLIATVSNVIIVGGFFRLLVRAYCEIQYAVNNLYKAKINGKTMFAIFNDILVT